MKNKIGLFAMMARMFNPGYPVKKPIAKKTVRQQSPEQALIARNLKRGLTYFCIDGQKVWALNRKNAVRKLLNKKA